MSPIEVGARAPAVPGIDLEPGPNILMFYKVTCPVCQMTAPVAERLFQRFPGHFAAIAQDPPEKIEDFGRQYGTSFPSVAESPPYDASNAFGVEYVPTLFGIADGEVVDVAESWDRDGWNRVTARLAELLGEDGGSISEPGDGLPPFRPG